MVFRLKRWQVVAASPLVLFCALLVLVPLLDPDGWREAQAEFRASRAEEARHPGAKAAAERAAAAAATAREKQAVLKTEAEAAAAERSGLNCLMGGDGSNPSTVREVKKNLRDPDSFQHIDTVIYPRIHGQHALIMKYRAKNGFGGMNVEVARARIDASNCQATLLPGADD